MNKYLKLKLCDYDINLRTRPETYKTILKECYGLNTETTKLRKKLSKLIRENHITNVPIKNLFNGRDILFYIIDKEYYILFVNNDCIYCKEINNDHKYVYTKECYKLKGDVWVKIKDKKYNYSEVILCL